LRLPEVPMGPSIWLEDKRQMARTLL
jgi:hypothetical protein